MSEQNEPIPEIATSWYDEDECEQAYKAAFDPKYGAGMVATRSGHLWEGFQSAWLLHHPRKPKMSACEKAYRDWRVSYFTDLDEIAWEDPIRQVPTWNAWQAAWEAKP